MPADLLKPENLDVESHGLFQVVHPIARMKKFSSRMHKGDNTKAISAAQAAEARTL